MNDVESVSLIQPSSLNFKHPEWASGNGPKVGQIEPLQRPISQSAGRINTVADKLLNAAANRPPEYYIPPGSQANVSAGNHQALSAQSLDTASAIDRSTQSLDITDLSSSTPARVEPASIDRGLIGSGLSSGAVENVDRSEAETPSTSDAIASEVLTGSEVASDPVSRESLQIAVDVPHVDSTPIVQRSKKSQGLGSGNSNSGGNSQVTPTPTETGDSNSLVKINAIAGQKPELGDAAEAEQSELAQPMSGWQPARNRIKAQPVSAAKVSNDLIPSNEPTKPTGDVFPLPVNYQRQTLPAQCDRQADDAPVVLRAYPVENHVVNDRRIADARTAAVRDVGENADHEGGLTDLDAVESKDPLEVDRSSEEDVSEGSASDDFRALPNLGQQTRDVSSRYAKTDKPAFQEPALNQRLNDIQQVPRRSTIPQGSTGSFTSPTSYQAPMDQGLEVLSEIAVAIDCGLVDPPVGHLHPIEPKLATTIGNVDSVWNSNPTAKIIYPIPFDRGLNSTPEFPSSLNLDQAWNRMQMLRLRAVTVSDHQAQVPPVVSMRQGLAPTVVRHMHPDVGQPVIDRADSESWFQVRPEIDKNPSDPSIQGLTLRPTNSTPGQRQAKDRRVIER